MTTIVKCNCKHEFQDRQYGVNFRVANNKATTEKTVKEATCTVCGTIHKVNK
jgi:hypothetical protein